MVRGGGVMGRIIPVKSLFIKNMTFFPQNQVCLFLRVMSMQLLCVERIRAKECS